MATIDGAYTLPSEGLPRIHIADVNRIIDEPVKTQICGLERPAVNDLASAIERLAIQQQADRPAVGGVVPPACDPLVPAESENEDESELTSEGWFGNKVYQGECKGCGKQDVQKEIPFSWSEDFNSGSLRVPRFGFGGVVRPACNHLGPAESENNNELKLIDKGCFGKIYRGKCKECGKQYALKKIRFTWSKDVEDDVLEEPRILRQLHGHKHIITCYKPEVKRNGLQATLFIRMEYCSGGSLRDAIQNDLDPVSRFFIIYDVLQALNYVHESGYIHGDLRSANICLDAEGNGILIDFGNAEPLYTHRDTEEAPYEGWDAERVKFDIKSIARIICEICFGPFDTEHALAKAVEQFETETASPFDYSGDRVPPLRHLLRTLLKGDLAEIPKQLIKVSPEKEKDLEERKLDTEPKEKIVRYLGSLRYQWRRLQKSDFAKFLEPLPTEDSPEKESYSSEKDDDKDLSSNEPSAGVKPEDTEFSIWKTVSPPLRIFMQVLVIIVIVWFALIISMHLSAWRLLLAVTTLETIHNTFVYRMMLNQIVKLTSRVT